MYSKETAKLETDFSWILATFRLHHCISNDEAVEEKRVENFYWKSVSLGFLMVLMQLSCTILFVNSLLESKLKAFPNKFIFVKWKWYSCNVTHFKIEVARQKNFNTLVSKALWERREFEQLQWEFENLKNCFPKVWSSPQRIILYGT